MIFKLFQTFKKSKILMSNFVWRFIFLFFYELFWQLFFLWKEDSFRQSNIIYFYLERKCWRHSSIFFLEKNVDFFSWKKMLKTLIYFFLGKKWWFFSLKKNDEDTHLFFFLQRRLFSTMKTIFFIFLSAFPRNKKQKALINKDLFLNLLIPTYDFFLRRKWWRHSSIFFLERR